MTTALDPDDVTTIRTLTYRYASALDTRREHELIDVFTTDGELDFGIYGCRVMPSAVDQLREAHLQYDETQHRVFNHIISINGDRATCRCYAEALYRSGTTLRRLHGRYEDDLARWPQGWRIASRLFVLFGEETLSLDTAVQRVS